jgi:hypothetical protein
VSKQIRFTVSSSSSLDRFLNRYGYQQWYVKLLVKHKAVYLFRGKSTIKPDRTDYFLKKGDYLFLLDPLPLLCKKYLDNVPAKDYRDYAYIPGESKFEKNMRKIMTRRPDTVVLPNTIVADLPGLVRILKAGKAIESPIRDLFFCSHANEDGRLIIGHSPALFGVVTYEHLERASQAGYLTIDGSVLDPRPKNAAGVAATASVNIRGCSIGATLPFLRQFAKALGGHVKVTAPKHIHVAFTVTKPIGVGECMMYAFRLNMPRKLRNLADAQRQFGDSGFRRVDGKEVTTREWARWIPNTVNQSKKWKVSLKAGGLLRGAPFSLWARYKYRAFKLFEKRQEIPVAKRPDTDDEKKQLARKALEEENPLFSAQHPFPKYVRLGYRSMEDFMNGWDWRFRWMASAKKLRFHPVRHEYEVRQPITDPATGMIVVNFFPRKGSPMIELREEDDRFFASVPPTG